MPGLQAFGRLWIVASDDFVFPAVLELVVNCSWYVPNRTRGGSRAARNSLMPMSGGFCWYWCMELLINLSEINVSLR